MKIGDAGARKGRKVARHCVFALSCGSGGSKSRLARAAGVEPAGQIRDETLHSVAAGSTFPSQNVQNTSIWDHFWKLRCRKSAHHCGAKHMLEVKMVKTTCSDHFWTSRCRKGARSCGTKHIWKSKVSKTERF